VIYEGLYKDSEKFTQVNKKELEVGVESKTKEDI